jgi:broad specificity phosphatase PhoE
MDELSKHAVIALARHGETTWNVAGRYQGRLESDLTPQGEAQSRALAAAFAGPQLPLAGKPVRIISSPLRRCRNTAAPLADQLSLPIEIDERLIEIGHGDWEGLLREEIAHRDPERFKAWRSKPASVRFTGGESLEDVAKRWQAFAAELATDDGVTVVVTHDAVVRVALLLLQERSLDELWEVPVENAAFARFDRQAGKLTLITPSYTGHLAALRTSVAGQAL